MHPGWTTLEVKQGIGGCIVYPSMIERLLLVCRVFKYSLKSRIVLKSGVSAGNLVDETRFFKMAQSRPEKAARGRN